jgi:hypothetical protein
MRTGMDKAGKARAPHTSLKGHGTSRTRSNNNKNAMTSRKERAAAPPANFRTATAAHQTGVNTAPAPRTQHKDQLKRATECGTRATATTPAAHGSMAAALAQAQTAPAMDFEIASIALTFFRKLDAVLRTQTRKQKQHREQTPCHWEVPSHNERRRPLETTPTASPLTREASVVSFNKKYHPSVKLKPQRRKTSARQRQTTTGEHRVKKLKLRKRSKKKTPHQHKTGKAKTTQEMKNSVRKSNGKHRKEKQKTTQESRKKTWSKERFSKVN